jgi:diaminopimelate decarboxylase
MPARTSLRFPVTVASASPWPAHAEFGPRGLEIAGMPAEDLAAEFGTPLIVFDEEQVRERCRTFASSFPRALYAVKAFTGRAVIRAALEEGMGLLASTGGELSACLRAGADPARISLHGNNKSDAELEAAVRSGVGLISIDHLAEVDRVNAAAAAAGVRQGVLLRVIPGVTAGTHSFIETGELDSKFGTPIAGGLAMEAVRAACAAPNLSFRGLHAHIGSQILSERPYARTIEVLFDLVRSIRDEVGVAVDVLDVGGGFGVRYVDEDPLPVADVAASMMAGITDAAAAHGVPVPEVVVEPGRSVVANAAVTLYRVGTVKRTPGVTTFVAVDGGMSDNIRPMLYGARYTMALAGAPRSGEPADVTVVGKHCETSDIMARDVRLDREPQRGDLLAVASTGAYTYSMASNYNRLGRPAVVGVRAGRATLWLRREDLDDLDRLEVGGPG